MVLNNIKLERTVILIKYITTIVSLLFILKTLTWDKIVLPASNLLNLLELMGIELKKTFSKSDLSDLSELLLFNVKFLKASY